MEFLAILLHANPLFRSIVGQVDVSRWKYGKFMEQKGPKKSGSFSVVYMYVYVHVTTYVITSCGLAQAYHTYLA